MKQVSDAVCDASVMCSCNIRPTQHLQLLSCHLFFLFVVYSLNPALCFKGSGMTGWVFRKGHAPWLPTGHDDLAILRVVI